MPLKVVVELQIHAVTCPGVFLPEKDDIFLSVSILGQTKATACLPAVFPLLFHEKMRFEKVFRKAVDPAAVAQRLESHTATFELTPMTHKVGDILAFYEENTREFLFPEPKLTPPYPGVDREVLMKTMPGFPGIAPKIEFSTRTIIKQSADLPKKCIADKHHFRRSLPNSPKRLSPSPRKNDWTTSSDKNYDSPTRSSKSRSPSPYTRRRICELNDDNQQRLAHLNLGDFTYKSDVDSRPPFIVRHVDHSKPLGEKSSQQLKSPKTKRRSKSSNLFHERPLRRALSYDSFRDEISSGKNILDSYQLSSSWKASSSVDTDNFLSFPHASSTRSLKGGSPFLERPLLRERLGSDQNTWESIHNRVRNLLTTHSAKQRLSFAISSSEVEDVLERRCITTKKTPNNSLVERF
ncbi:spermatogenesis associated 6-like protein isoform 1-T2 [Discoglossus pictus]